MPSVPIAIGMTSLNHRRDIDTISVWITNHKDNDLSTLQLFNSRPKFITDQSLHTAASAKQ
eukprot:scaffold12782_cov168-Amphora_coffeaeformis.AAC.5